MWPSPDISLAVVPPSGVCLPRSADNLTVMVALAEVETAERYRKRDLTGDDRPETFCNIFVSDVTRWIGAEIPHDLPETRVTEHGDRITIHRWQDVRANAEWLRAGNGGWRACSAAEASEAAEHGRPAVVLWDPPARAHGHIALLVPSRGEGGVWIAQAGATNFSRGRLVRGFGNAAPLEWFCHD